MATLFRRSATLQVGTTKIEGLRIAASVKKTLQSEPNTAEISVWNLSPTNRARFQEKNQTLLLQAGYDDQLEQIFVGDVSVVTTTREGPDWLTKVVCGDGERAFREAKITQSFKAGTTKEQVLKEYLGKSGLDYVKDLASLFNKSDKTKPQEYAKGFSVSGSVSKELNRFCESNGLEWSIQNGLLQLLPKGKTVDNTAFLLKPTTGLIGSPQIGEKGIVKARSLLNGKLNPGKQVKIESELINGFFRIETALFNLDTHAGDFQVEIEGKPFE